MMMKMMLVAFAASALAACSDAGEQAAERGVEATNAIDTTAAAQAVVSAVDLEAAKNMVEGAARNALRETFDAGEIAAAAAIVDEETLIDGLGQAIDGQAIGQTVQGAIDGLPGKPNSEPAE